MAINDDKARSREAKYERKWLSGRARRFLRQRSSRNVLRRRTSSLWETTSSYRRQFVTRETQVGFVVHNVCIRAIIHSRRRFMNKLLRVNDVSKLASLLDWGVGSSVVPPRETHSNLRCCCLLVNNGLISLRHTSGAFYANYMFEVNVEAH